MPSSDKDAKTPEQRPSEMDDTIIDTDEHTDNQKIVLIDSIHERSSSGVIDEKLLAIIFLCYATLPPVFYFIRTWLSKGIDFESTLDLIDIYILECLGVFVGVGGYQLYFWVQRNSFLGRAPYNVPRIPWIDHWNFGPNWIYFYSLFYYTWCAALVISFTNYEDMVKKTVGGLILLISLAICFYIFPTSGSHGQRPTDHGVWLLQITQELDKPRNGCPSGHMTFATYVFLCLFKLTGWYGLIPVLITGISCLKLKQHTFLDLLCGTLFAPMVYFGGVKFLIER